MFVRNRTQFDLHLARGHVTDDVGVGALIIEVTHAVGERGLEPVLPPPDRKLGDPPKPAPYTMWEGVGVTASGTAYDPGRAPHVRPVVLQVGSEVRRLIVFGDRHWEPSGNTLRATPAAPFDAMPIGFDRAYGGSFDVPPGILPGVDLPHPGYRASYPLNGDGIGFYLEEQQARGNRLPNVERPDQLIKAWDDRPEPAGFSPCPDLVALRTKRLAEKMAGQPLPQDGVSALAPSDPPFVLQHHAPGVLIFDALEVDVPISIEGLGGSSVRTRLTASPITVTLRTRKRRLDVAPRVRSIHLDADARIQRTVFDHAFFYPVADPPEWVTVEAAKGA